MNERGDQQPGPPRWPEPPPPPDVGMWERPPAQPPPGYGAPHAPGGNVHPLTVGRALSLGWSLFTFRWRALVVVMLVASLPGFLANALWVVAYGGVLEAWLSELASAPPQRTPPIPWDAAGMSLVVFLITSVAGLIGSAAAIHVLGWTYGGSAARAMRSLGAGLRRVMSLLGAALLFVLAVAATMAVGGLLVAAALGALGPATPAGVLVALIVAVSTVAAVIFLAVRWIFYVQAIMLEGHGAVAGLGRSWRLVSGSTWRVLGYVLLFVALFFVYSIVVGVVQVMAFGLGMAAVTGGAPDAISAVGQMAIQVIASAVATPFYLAVLTLLYYDLRWRAREQIGPPPA